MKKFFEIASYTALAFTAFGLGACSSDDKDMHTGGATEETQIAIEDKTIAGVSEKGPFVKGSAVRLYELNVDNLGQTGRAFTGKIASDRGDFRFTHLNLESQYVLLEANGFYRNEVSGKNSAASISLNALVDVSDRETANINLLTHLAYERMQHLVDDGSSVAEAKKQAEQEILKAFQVADESIEGFEGLSIFESGKGNAVLLAISILMQGELSEAEFSERLADFAYDIENDGVWDDSVTATKIADWASARSEGDYYASIRKNMEDWELSDDIPAFEKYVDNFWWQNYGLGICDETREGEVLATTNKHSVNYESQVRYICRSNSWREFTIWDASKEVYLNPDIEYDSITDVRDNQSYKIVKIGSQVWMAENLNYADSNKTPSLKGNSWCYGNEMKNCEVAGRYYDKKIIAEICPQGWHIPSQEEWEVMFKTVGGSIIEKSYSESVYNPESIVGMDEYGFSTIPAGCMFGGSAGDCSVGYSAAFFTSTECENGTISRLNLRDRPSFWCDEIGFDYNVRCIKDEE